MTKLTQNPLSTFIQHYGLILKQISFFLAINLFCYDFVRDRFPAPTGTLGVISSGIALLHIMAFLELSESESQWWLNIEALVLHAVYFLIPCRMSKMFLASFVTCYLVSVVVLISDDLNNPFFALSLDNFLMPNMMKFYGFKIVKSNPSSLAILCVLALMIGSKYLIKYYVSRNRQQQ